MQGSTSHCEDEGKTEILGCMLYSVYAVGGVCCIWCMQYMVYVEFGLCCTLCILYTVVTHDNCQQRFRTVTPGPGLVPSQSIVRLAVCVVSTPEPSTQVQFDSKLPTNLRWAGCQQVAQRVHT
jgi:hypothetical protein